MESRDIFFRKIDGKFPSEDIEKIEQAYKMAEFYHEGQTRRSGEPYVEHPLRVALIPIDELEIYNVKVTVGGLLHDVIEDCPITFREIQEKFGDDVVRMLKFLSRFNIHVNGSEIIKELKRDYEARLLRSDRETQLVKLCDHLHNLRTLISCPPKSRRRKLKDARRFYLFLAKQVHPKLYELINEAVNDFESVIAKRGAP